jgi:glycosyltransferase involved in cell wall biosynthesis
LTTLAHAVEIAGKTHGEIDVVIVDNGSRDASAAIAAAHLRLFANKRLVRLPWPCGKRTAVGAGISEAVGERLLVLSADHPVDGDHLLAVAGLLDSADAVLSAPPPMGAGASGGRRSCTEFVAFRADVAEDLILCCRPAGLAYDLGTRMVSEAMNLRLAQLPQVPTGAALLRPEPRRGARPKRRRHRIGHLLRAYRRRSKLAAKGDANRVRLRPLADAEAAIVRRSPVVPPQPAPSVAALPPAIIDLTATEEPRLVGLTAPSEQPGALM